MNEMSSYIRTSDALCQECLRRFETDKSISTSINLDTDSFEKELFLTGKLNKVTCPYCMCEFTYEIPLVIFSFSKKFACYVTPSALPGEKINPIPLQPFIFGEGFRCRTVDYLIEALEKYKIELNSCDDYIVEYIKLNFFDDKDALPTNEINLLFDSKDEDVYYFVQTDYNNQILNKYNICFPDSEIPEHILDKSKSLNNYLWHKINRIR